MSNAETLLNLESDLEAVVLFVQEHDGQVAIDPDDPQVYWITLRPRGAPDERYFVRVAWQSYPHDPPSVKFGTEVGGGVASTSAWPIVSGYRPESFDICKPFTAEGYAVHPDWRAGPHRWQTSGNPFRWVVEVIQNDLDNNYGGRAQ